MPPPLREKFWRPTRYQELAWSFPKRAMNSMGVRLAPTMRAIHMTARVATAGFQDLRKGKRGQRPGEKIIIIHGPGAMGGSTPTGRAAEAMIQGKMLRFLKKRLVAGGIQKAKYQPKMM